MECGKQWKCFLLADSAAKNDEHSAVRISNETLTLIKFTKEEEQEEATQSGHRPSDEFQL